MRNANIKHLNEGNLLDFHCKGIKDDYQNCMKQGDIELINNRIKNELGEPFISMYVSRGHYLCIANLTKLNQKIRNIFTTFPTLFHSVFCSV